MIPSTTPTTTPAAPPTVAATVFAIGAACVEISFARTITLTAALRAFAGAPLMADRAFFAIVLTLRLVIERFADFTAFLTERLAAFTAFFAFDFIVDLPVVFFFALIAAAGFLFVFFFDWDFDF